MLELFPDGTRIDGDELVIGGIPAEELVRSHGSPLLVYDEATLRACARAYRGAAPEALICYGTKAFPNLAVMRVLAAEGSAPTSRRSVSSASRSRPGSAAPASSSTATTRATPSSRRRRRRARSS